jgi:hypothetical protein
MARAIWRFIPKNRAVKQKYFLRSHLDLLLAILADQCDSNEKRAILFKWVCSLLNHAPQVVVVHQSKIYGEQGRNLQPVPSTDRTITLGSSSYVD